MTYQDFLLDKRIVQRNIARGVVDAKTYEKLITALPDRADNAQATTIGLAAEEEVDSLDDGDDDEGDDE